MTEVDVALTDYALTFLCGLFAWRLYRGQKLWSWFFISVALASLIGGTVHGFFNDKSTLENQVLWLATMLSIGVTSAMGYILGGTILTGVLHKKKWTVFATVTFFIYSLVAIFYSRSFLVVIINYLPAMVLILLGSAWQYRRTQLKSYPWLISGILVSFIAAAIQQVGIAIHPQYFTYNSTYHLIQGFGLWLIYKGALNLEPK